MDALARYEKKVQEGEQLEKDRQRRLGSREQMLKRLKEEHGCKSLGEAKLKQSKLKKEFERLEKEVNAALDTLEAGRGED